MTAAPTAADLVLLLLMLRAGAAGAAGAAATAAAAAAAWGCLEQARLRTNRLYIAVAS